MVETFKLKELRHALGNKNKIYGYPGDKLELVNRYTGHGGITYLCVKNITRGKENSPFDVQESLTIKI